MYNKNTQIGKLANEKTDNVKTAMNMDTKNPQKSVSTHKRRSSSTEFH